MLFNTQHFLLALVLVTGVKATCPNIPLTQPYYPAAANCVEYTIPVSAISENSVFPLPKWEDDYAVVDFFAVASTRAGANYPGFGNKTVVENATYEIAASFCSPKKTNGKETTVILATHGIGQGRSHWNSPYKPEEYNFVQFANAQGYSVFFYDRLGSGESQKVSGFTNQINKQVAILQELAVLVRRGRGKYTNGIYPKKLALMGFSFGSYTTHAAIAAKPDIADAVILTAVGFNATGLNINGLIRSFVPRIASLQNPMRFGALDTGYLSWADKFVQINTYFKYPFYDAPTVDFAEAKKEAFGIGEFLTFAAPASVSVANFTGAALHITGVTDYIVCDGYCPGIWDEPAKTHYKNAKLTQYLHPGASHNINFHHNATGAYKVITDFLAASGL
ncbi:hypothetical protein IFR05_003234 [Cadophora sp. M221]|nr:hypothetical protein IFR05_003234 [Cadophora sp. M221]